MLLIDPRLNEITDALYRVSVKALIFDNNKILLVKESEDEWWGLPGGGIDHDEKVPVALKREVEEEIGVPQVEVNSNWQVEFISIGEVVENVPRLSLYYRVEVPVNKVTKTNHVSGYQWADEKTLRKLYLSPSIKNILDKIIVAMNKV